MESFPPVLIAAFVFAQVVALAELAAWFFMSPALYRLLPLRHRPAVALSPTTGAPEIAEGQTTHAKWRYDAEANGIAFRRQLGFGRRPLSAGWIQLGQGAPEIRWAPFPFFTYGPMLLVVAGFFALAGGSGLPISMVPMFLGFFGLVIAINVGISWYSFKNTVLPEMEIALLDQQSEDLSVFD